MTTVADLIAYLKQFPEDALVFTNQCEGDMTEEHPIDLVRSAFYPDALTLQEGPEDKLSYALKGDQNEEDFTEDDINEMNVFEHRAIVRLLS
jgi:hypothetical protein